MGNGSVASVVKYVRRIASLADLAASTDGQLLEGFVSCRDDDALTELVRRHGPMVLGVCRRVLANAADAEDAFQATFLVLVRKAQTVVPREMVGKWLYGVARRTALFAKRNAAKQFDLKRGPTRMCEPKANADRVVEMLAVLDEELGRLPEKYRVPIILCDLSGRSIRNVANQLKVPNGTIASRLHRARLMLANRMKRHSESMTVTALAVLLAGQASASLPPTLLNVTAKAVVATAGCVGSTLGVTSHVAQLTEGVLKLMLLT